jgi:hypothetical protein
MCTIVFSIAGAPLYILAMKLYTRFPVSMVLRVAALIVILGGWTRQISSIDNHSFWPYITGFTIIAIGNPLIYTP